MRSKLDEQSKWGFSERLSFTNGRAHAALALKAAEVRRAALAGSRTLTMTIPVFVLIVNVVHAQRCLELRCTFGDSLVLSGSRHARRVNEWPLIWLHGASLSMRFASVGTA